MLDRKVTIQLRSYEPWEKTAKIMADVGFNKVAILLDEDVMLLDSWKSKVEKMCETFSKLGLECVQTHAPYYNLLISAEKRDEKLEKAMLNSIEASNMLGSKICAVHPRSFIVDGRERDTAVDREKSLKENIVSFSPLVNACEKYGVSLGVENLMKYPFEHPYFYSWIAEDHAELVDKLDSKNVCAIWDFGHANLVDEVDQAERIKILGSRIKGTHVHNNCGIDDNHFPPLLPEAKSYYVRRSVNWNSVLKALAQTGFDGCLTLETVFHYDYPIEGYIRYLYDSICVLDDILRKGK